MPAPFPTCLSAGGSSDVRERSAVVVRGLRGALSGASETSERGNRLR